MGVVGPSCRITGEGVAATRAAGQGQPPVPKLCFCSGSPNAAQSYLPEGNFSLVMIQNTVKGPGRLQLCKELLGAKTLEPHGLSATAGEVRTLQV